MDSQVRTVDVSGLPTFAFGSRSLLWWATLGIICIEGTVFALAIAGYIYLRGRQPNWPPNLPPPDKFWGTVNMVIMLVSVVPNEITKRWSEKLNLARTRIWLAVCCAIALAFLIVRVFEFGSLNCRWDSNAYGSIVWTLLGLHTTHLLTDWIDSVVLLAVLFARPSAKRFVDTSENSFYWYFVVLSWIPIYVVIYFGPALL
jgi:cytochrome c oxidase subunit 1/cytochrome c oxidase subunit I+III